MGRTAGDARKVAAAYAAAGLACILNLWAMIVRDDGSGGGVIMMVLGGAMAAWAVRFEAAGLARVAAGMAVLQLLSGALVATATPTLADPGASVRMMIGAVVLAGLWLWVGWVFRRAAVDLEGGAVTE